MGRREHPYSGAVPGPLEVAIVKAVRAPVAPGFLRGVLEAAAAEREVALQLSTLPERPELTVRLTGDRELRRLNRAFLGENHATDVLSFPSGDAASGYLGDLALSWPAVVRQAAEAGHEPEVEAALLVVHGLLHLLGWDHATSEEEAAMTAVTMASLRRVGLRPAAGRLHAGT